MPTFVSTVNSPFDGVLVGHQVNVHTVHCRVRAGEHQGTPARAGAQVTGPEKKPRACTVHKSRGHQDKGGQKVASGPLWSGGRSLQS